MRFARTAAVAGVLVGLLGVSLPSGPAAADSVEATEREAAKLADRIEQLEVRAEQLTEEYNQATLDLQQAGDEVEAAKARLVEHEADLATLRTDMAKVALTSYVSYDQGAGIASVLDENALAGQGAVRSGYVTLALGARVEVADRMRSTLEDAERQRREVEGKQKRQQQLAAAARKKQAAVDQAGADARAALEDVQGDLVRLVAAEEQRRQDAAAAEQRQQIARQQREAEAVAARAAEASRAASTTRPATAAGGQPGAARPAAPAARPPAATRPAAPKAAAPAAPKPAAPPARPVPPPSPGAAGAVAAALSQVGNRYVAYAASPEAGFDCSGLTMWAWGQAGVRLPHQSGVQYATLAKVPIDQLLPGDLVFSHTPISHVGLYIGGGQMVHAASPRHGVQISPIRNVVGAARPGG